MTKLISILNSNIVSGLIILIIGVILGEVKIVDKIKDLCKSVKIFSKRRYKNFIGYKR